MYLHGLLVGVVHVRLALGYHLAGQLVKKGDVERKVRGEKGQNYEGMGYGWYVVSVQYSVNVYYI